MDKIELSNGKSIVCKSLTEIEFEALLKQGVPKQFNSFKDKYEIDVYQLLNKEVIVKEGDYYTWYNNLDDLNKVLDDASGSGIEILHNNNIYGETFPNFTDTLINELLSELNIENRKFDKDLLNAIDIKVSKLKDPKSFRKKHLLHFIVIIGETLIKDGYGMWSMELASDGITWNPYLKIKDHNINYFIYLYEDIYMDNAGNMLLETYETVKAIINDNQ